MKKLILTVAVLLAACATAPSQEKTYDVWESPGPNGQGTLPAYRVKEMPNGEVRVYDYGNPFEPKYIIRGNEAYKPGNPFEPVGNIKNGLPTTDKKGVK
jgi:hypothetical protein